MFSMGISARIVKRIITLLIVTLGVVTLSFCLQIFTGTDPAEMLVRKTTLFATEEQIQAMRVELGLDGTLSEQYADYIKGLLTGDLGISITNRKPVIDNIRNALPVTCMLVIMSISFSIDGGEMLSIVGSSGAGKTTVCKAVMGLLSSNYSISGEVLYRGENLLHCSKKRLQAIYGKEICYIMQNPMTAFNPSLRIGRQLEKTCYLHNPQISRQELQLLVSNTLQQLGLDDLKRILKSYPDALSGGMLQRIMIAAALINQPTILVADEATTAIDACNRIELMQLLRQLCSGGMAILFVTHDLRAASMADRILIMNDGQLVEAGTTEQIFNEPKEEYTKYLLSACTLERR